MLHPLIADPHATLHVLKKFKLRAVKGLGNVEQVFGSSLRRDVF